MLIVKLTIDEVTADGIESDTESTMTVVHRDALADGVETLCRHVLASLDDDGQPDDANSELAAPQQHTDRTSEADSIPTTGPLDGLTERELARLRMTVENENVRDRNGRFDPIASADDLAIVLPILRKLLAAQSR